MGENRTRRIWREDQLSEKPEGVKVILTPTEVPKIAAQTAEMEEPVVIGMVIINVYTEMFDDEFERYQLLPTQARKEEYAQEIVETVKLGIAHLVGGDYVKRSPLEKAKGINTGMPWVRNWG